MNQIRVRPDSTRPGFSKVDFLVVLGLVLLLAAIAAPGILTAQQQGRELGCLNNIRMIGLGVQNYASITQGSIPPLTTELSITNATGQEATLLVGWPVILLPSMDRAAQFKKLQETAVVENGKARLAETERVAMPFMTCADDPDAQGKAGRTSYVANVGFISRDLYAGDPDRKHQPGSLSWDDNATTGEARDVAIHAATGVFWVPSADHQPSLDYVATGDGMTSTIMFVENLQAGDWFDTDTARIGFGYPVENVEHRVSFGAGSTFESKIAPLNAEKGTLTTFKLQDWRINADPKAKPGTRPRPSSRHNGFANVVMCDGAARKLNQRIDPQVYLKMVTSNGVTYGEKLLHAGTY